MNIQRNTRMHSKKRSQSGMSLMEVMVALAIVGTMIMASSIATTTAHKMTTLNTDKEFGTQKAISILEEMKALVQVNSNGNIVSLDTFDDANKNNPVLTIQHTHPQPTDTWTETLPQDPISGNSYIGTDSNGNDMWQYERHITVTTPPGQASRNDVRLVDVAIYKNTAKGRQLLAEVSSVIRTIVTSMPPSQVYDVYMVAVENVPGWWTFMSNMIQVVATAISNLEGRNPGLQFRQHWITALSYGRDQEYRPYVNDAIDATHTNDSVQDINYVYFYPGRMPDATGVYAPTPGDPTKDIVGNNYYYVPSYFKGHVLINSTDKNGYDADSNPFPYALADQYNHSMRYPDEKALYTAREGANPSEEMTWRLLLEDMYSHPDQYVNALVINLHGELLPFPPIRNYSDAAKCPEPPVGGAPNLQGVRVVTHPEQLAYANAGTVNFRVYSYVFDPDNPGPKNNLPNTVPISLVFHDSNGWVPVQADITAIWGGKDDSSPNKAIPYGTGTVARCASIPPPVPVGGASPAANMCWDYALTGATNQDTTIKLYNSPLVAPYDTATGSGLDWSSRLYDMEYIPSPVEDLTGAAVPFTINLTDTNPRPKNTARWVIKVPAGKCPTNGTMVVDTRIGDQATSGVLWPTRDHPANLSRTYAWRGDDNWLYGDLTTSPVKAPNLPITERYQFQGDPRHCPYADLKRPFTGTNGGVSESKLGMGYNRNFDNFEDTKYNGAYHAQVIGSVAGSGASLTFPIVTTPAGSATNQLVVKTFDSTNNSRSSTVIVSSTGGNINGSTIVSNLNASSPFKNYAVADLVNGHLRIMPKTNAGTSTVQLDTAANGSNANGVFGFDTKLHSSKNWTGWTYGTTTVTSATHYGIKNDSANALADAAGAGWDTSAGDMDIDTARIFQITRSSLIKANALWTTMTGWSYYYIGIGNEIGYDSANHFMNSVPVSKMPFSAVTGAQYVDSITSNLSQGVYYVKAFTNNTNAFKGWWSMPWLGELYPDGAYDSAVSGVPDWLGSGNLPTNPAATSNYFVRDLRSAFPPFPGTALESSVHRTAPPGSVSMFWTGTSASSFHHTGEGATDTADIQTDGTDIANHYAYPVPDSILSNRPFNINLGGTNPDAFLQNAYPLASSTNASIYTAANPAPNTVTLLNTYYKHHVKTSEWSSALYALSDPKSKDVAFITVNGLSPAGDEGTAFISNWAFLTLIQGYLNGGLYSDASHHVRQLPRVAITDPNLNTNLKNPSAITIAWTSTWKRWDNNPYTSAAGYASYSETGLNVTYQVMYSPTGGVPDKTKGANDTGWYFIQDDASATPGVPTTVTAEKVTGTTVNWTSVSDATRFPEGNYLIRVEAYRQGLPLHYSFHQYRAYISRT